MLLLCTTLAARFVSLSPTPHILVWYDVPIRASSYIQLEPFHAAQEPPVADPALLTA